jgi:hypothetical protein
MTCLPLPADRTSDAASKALLLRRSCPNPFSTPMPDGHGWRLFLNGSTSASPFPVIRAGRGVNAQVHSGRSMSPTAAPQLSIKGAGHPARSWGQVCVTARSAMTSLGHAQAWPGFREWGGPRERRDSAHRQTRPGAVDRAMDFVVHQVEGHCFANLCEWHVSATRFHAAVAQLRAIFAKVKAAAARPQPYPAPRPDGPIWRAVRLYTR